MKLILLMFAFVCLNNPQPGKETKKKTTAPKKEAKRSFNLAPSILIINY